MILRDFLQQRFSRQRALGLSLTFGFLACAGLFMLFGILSREVLSVGGSAAFDREVALEVRQLHTRARDQWAEAVTFLGDYRFLTPAGLAAATALALRGRPGWAILFAGAILGGFLLESVFKITFHRARPHLWPALVTEKSYSFPSGHATMVTVFFGGLVAFVFHVSRRLIVRALALLVAATLILAVAMSRVYLGAHWPTDVLAGILLGLFWLVLCATGAGVFARGADSRKDDQRL